MLDSLFMNNQMQGITTRDILELSIGAVTALGTLLLALVAIYGERIKRWLFRPKLSAKIRNASPFIDKYEHSFSSSNSTEQKSTTLIIKVQVENAGSTGAQLCRGLVQNVFCNREKSETFYEMRALVPTPLMWNDDSREYTISPLVPAFIEIARIEEIKSISKNTDSEAVEASEYLLYLSIEEPGSSGLYIKLGKGTFIIPIIFTSDSIRLPFIEYLEIFWNGKDPSTADNSNFFVKLLSSSEVPTEVRVKK